jgi:DNA-binding GntR family transcriptional regulator
MHKWSVPPTVSRSYLADHTYEVLHEAIVSGELASGTPLHENEIAAQVGVSRTPVREALRRLQIEGLATKTMNGSLIVSKVTSKLITEAFALRKLLEGYAANEAAKVTTEADVARMQAIIDEAQQAILEGGSDRLPELNDRFHGSIEDLANNSLLKKTTHMLREQTVAYHAFVLGRPVQQQSFVDDHKAILTALAEGDGEHAQKLVAQHLEMALQLILMQPNEKQSENH